MIRVMLSSGHELDIPIRVQDMDTILAAGPNKENNGYLELYEPIAGTRETRRYNVRPEAIVCWYRYTHALDTEQHHLR